MYGYIVSFLDDRGYSFDYYAKYSATEEEAEQEYRLEALERGYKPSLLSVRVATRAEWENFDIHGDTWHSPNAQFGLK
jgi:hypothetical protein